MRNRTIVEGAKELRSDLKMEYPGIKFSVKSNRNACGIEVNWTDGPSNSDVLAYCRKNFTGTVATSCETIFNVAEMIYTDRSYSRSFLKAVLTCFVSSYPDALPPCEIMGEGSHAYIGFYGVTYNTAAVIALNDLIRKTDEKNMHSACTAKDYAEEKKTAQQKEEAASRKRKEDEARSKRPFVYASSTSKEAARSGLGVSMNATREEIMTAFRSKVKGAATGNGGYKEDMDLLVKMKERAL